MIRTLLPPLAALGLAVAATSVQAQDPLGYSLQAEAPAVCTLVGEVADGVVVEGGSATFTLSLQGGVDQQIGSLAARCNGGGATISISSANGFRLMTQGGGPNQELPYTISVPGTSLAGGVRADATFQEPNAGGAPVDRAITVRLDPFDVNQVLAGVYLDTVTVSVTPAI
jgi:hypothetical protein